MWYTLGVILLVGLMGCSGSLLGECGSARTVTVRDTTATLMVNLFMTEEETTIDVVGWDIRIPGGSDVTAVHLHDRTPGNGNRMVLDLTVPDQDPGPDWAVGYGRDYSYTDSITNLLDLVRTGNSYIDVHLNNDPVPAIRYDVSNAIYQDWRQNVCST